jgi:hypothetical protein
MLAQRRPHVLFDHAHRNVHSTHGRYRPFVRLIEADGCRVRSSSKRFSTDGLGGVDILVVVNARGPKSDAASAAFTEAECDAVRDWVAAGGSLLLVADHHPCGPAAAMLAGRFGVQMSGGWTDDEANARAGAGDTGQILFTRAAGRLADHPITRGWSAMPSRAATTGAGTTTTAAAGGAAEVNTVETFTGQSVFGPPDAVPLLLLADTAIDRVPVSAEVSHRGSETITTFQTDDRPAAGHCQGLAMRYGRGRVVVLAEAAMLTAQVDRTGRRFGMNAGGNDNRAFALNVIRWLAGALDE